jgi:CMP-N-acetylneuraminic acid synthetase
MRYPRRQDLPPAFNLNGGLYLNRCTSLRESHQFQPPGAHGWIMPECRSVDIDTLNDFAIVENIMAGH